VLPNGLILVETHGPYLFVTYDVAEYLYSLSITAVKYFDVGSNFVLFHLMTFLN